MINIDLDRGVHMRSHPTLGMDIYMYVDTPGVYFSAHGEEVDSKLAEQAGFPVDNQLKLRARNDAMKVALAEIDAKFGQNRQEVAYTRDGYRVMDLGDGAFNVVASDGELLNTKGPISRAQADTIMKHVAPQKVQEAKK